MKGIILISSTVGSIVGAYLPSLWGDSNGFGAMSLILGTVGAIVGIWAGWKIGNSLEI